MLSRSDPQRSSSDQPQPPASHRPGLLRAVLIEAFSSGPFTGNGAAVVALEGPAPDAWMQALATSLRQSETAFLLQLDGQWMLRWFTPSCEVPLCGHATLAALLALGHWGMLEPGGTASLHTRSGPLLVGRDAEQPWWGTLVLPAADLVPATLPPDLASLLQERLGCLPEACWGSELGYGVVLLPPAAPLAAMASLADRLQAPLSRGLVLMQALQPGPGVPQICGEDADYQLRFFAPGLGIPEDPVTGSAHALVARWWQERFGRKLVRGWQCSDRPGGMVCEAASSGMIRLSGSGHLLWDGTLPIASGGWANERLGATAAAFRPEPADWSAWRAATRLPSSTPSGAIPC